MSQTPDAPASPTPPATSPQADLAPTIIDAPAATVADASAAEAGSSAARERAARALGQVAAAVRTHNLLLLFAFVALLVALTVQYQTRQQIESLLWLRLSEVLRVALPLAALALTGVFTSRRMQAALARDPGRPPALEDAAPVFVAAKKVSSWLLGLALVANVAFLATGDRVADFLLAAFAALLFMTTRPSPRAMISFAAVLKTLWQRQADDARS